MTMNPSPDEIFTSHVYAPDDQSAPTAGDIHEMLSDLERQMQGYLDEAGDYVGPFCAHQIVKALVRPAGDDVRFVLVLACRLGNSTEPLATWFAAQGVTWSPVPDPLSTANEA